MRAGGRRGQPGPPPLAALSGSRNFSRVKGPFSLGGFSRVKREGPNFRLLRDQPLRCGRSHVSLSAARAAVRRDTGAETASIQA